MENYIFWSETGSGFGEPGGIPPPRNSRSTPPGIQLPRCLFLSSPSLIAEIEDEPCKEKYVHFFVTPLNTNWNEYFLLLFFTSMCFNAFGTQK